MKTDTEFYGYKDREGKLQIYNRSDIFIKFAIIFVIASFLGFLVGFLTCRYL